MAPKITGGESFLNGRKIVNVTDAEMANVQLLAKAGVGQPGPMSDRAAAAVLSIQKDRDASPGQRYRDFLSTMKFAVNSSNPQVREEWLAANRDYINRVGCPAPGRVQAASPRISEVHTDAALANLTTQYANDEFIGESLAPPVLVGKKTDIFYTYGKRDRLTQVESDLIAEDGEAPSVIESRSTGSYSCVDRGLKNSIAANTVANQDAPLDELFDLTAGLVERRGLAREVRIATLCTTAGNYDAANQTTLAGANQWNAAGGGDPIGDLQTADAALWRGVSPAMTKAFSSLAIYNVLSRHEDFLGLFQYGGSPIGLATPKMIAGFLGWDDYLVGRARQQTAQEGDTAVYARLWGDFFGVLRVADRQTLRSATFGCTARWTMPGVAGANQGILSQQWFDQTKGLGGSHFAKVGESEDHFVQADDAGYLIIDALA